MRRLNSQVTGIDQGSLMLFSDFETGGDMWTGEGARELRKTVEFSEKFSSPPIVNVSISLWDIDQKSNQRADIAAENIRLNQFEVVFRTWGDTQVARIRADWLAIGELADDEIWDVE
ncbi:MAG: H-type lectin domain-containing protein [Marinosulfonomonas sp.]|nr:H-type lectin domain-containing protein [Marinosulfonomonas sp.]